MLIKHDVGTSELSRGKWRLISGQEVDEGCFGVGISAKGRIEPQALCYLQKRVRLSSNLTTRIDIKGLTDHIRQTERRRAEMDVRKKEKIASLLTEEAQSSYCDISEAFVISPLDTTLTGQDSLNSIKQKVKRHLPGIYPKMIKIFSPVYGKDLGEELLRSRPADQYLTLNLGAGTHTYKDVVAVDGFNYHSVDVVCNLETLPFRANSIDSIISIAVLEHVASPSIHVKEFFRVLKEDGEVVCFVPFMQPFHASPWDFQRFTDEGLRQLFKDFQILEVKVGAGPTSSFVWVLQEWLSLLLSFGSERLYRVLQIVTLLLSPLKIIDVFLENHPSAKVLASGFVIHARKRSYRAKI